VRRGLGGQQKVTTGGSDRVGDRLAGEKIVAEIDRPLMFQLTSMQSEPTFGGVVLPILLLSGVLAHLIHRMAGIRWRM
jgi:hypothetical protein